METQAGAGAGNHPRASAAGRRMLMGQATVALLLFATATKAVNQRHVQVTLVALETALQSSASSQPAAQGAPSDAASQMRLGVDAFRQGDCAGALRLFRQVVVADPGNIVAYNLAANCSLKLKDYPSAIDSFKRALQLQPDEFHNVSGLIHAYTLAGMASERDDLRKRIAALEHDGKLPANFNYVFETFQAGDRSVEVSEFPQIQGFYGERYRFDVFASDGKQVFRVALESAAAEQPKWAAEHPKEAAAGGRFFSLDGYSGNTHFTYEFFDGEPPYEQVREKVKQILAGQKAALSQTTFGTPPKATPTKPDTPPPSPH